MEKILEKSGKQGRPIQEYCLKVVSYKMCCVSDPFYLVSKFTHVVMMQIVCTYVRDLILTHVETVVKLKLTL